MICPLVRSVRKHETAPWGLPGIFFFTALPVHEEQLPLDTLAMGSEREPFLLLRNRGCVKGQAGMAPGIVIGSAVAAKLSCGQGRTLGSALDHLLLAQAG